MDISLSLSLSHTHTHTHTQSLQPQRTYYQEINFSKIYLIDALKII